MTQDELKSMVGQAAIAYVTPGQVVGVGTGSTVNRFIDALGAMKGRIAGAVSSSNASTARLQALGIPVLQADQVDELSLYVDGADEIDQQGFMIKGGGAALTREKIIASMAQRFICIADQSKLVRTLGQFPLPVEVVPMAGRHLIRRFGTIGGSAELRLKDGAPLLTDNGLQILDVSGLRIEDPLAFENEVSQWPGVLTVGVFARQKASVCLLGTPAGVTTLNFQSAPVDAKT